MWSEEEKEARKQELLDKAVSFSHFTDRKDEFRIDTASSSGGFELRDAEQTSLLRSAGTEIIAVSCVALIRMYVLLTLLFLCIDGRAQNHAR